MTSWPKALGFNTSYLDAITGPTPLAIIKEGLNRGDSLTDLMAQLPSQMDLFLGNMGGSLGEGARHRHYNGN